MVEISIREFQHLKDMAACADSTGMVGYCPSGRPILAGYVCIHCGRDTSVEKGCGEPRGGTK